MIALIQRVTEARVEVDNKIIGNIDQGIMALIGVEKDDDKQKANRLIQRLLGYRIFSDDQGKMNLNVTQVEGGVLLVPQFTLPADTKKGMRPSFSSAASPEDGTRWFDYFVEQCRSQYGTVETGQFGADMKVYLCNDGPVTFWLQV